jgi:hypothetical protein
VQQRAVTPSRYTPRRQLARERAQSGAPADAVLASITASVQRAIPAEGQQ